MHQDTERVSIDEPRFELEVRARSARSTFTLAALVGLVVSVRFPLEVGASLMLPMVFLTVGHWIEAGFGSVFTVRVSNDAVELEGNGVVWRTAWVHIESLGLTASGLTIVIASGERVVVPRPADPRDDRALLNALGRRREIDMTAAPSTASTTLPIFAVVLAAVVFYTLYQLVATP